MRKTTCPISQSGFTLVELMIASLILITGMLSVASMVLFALSASHNNRIESAALHLSQQKLEELKSLPLDDLRLAGPGNPLDAEMNIDFDAGANPMYSASSDWVLNSFRNTRIQFETRWNVLSVGSQKMITVASRCVTGTPFHTRPANLKLLKGR
jgi:prepilin-type N-terminal cleavage/methylation domain-containing protein